MSSGREGSLVMGVVVAAEEIPRGYGVVLGVLALIVALGGIAALFDVGGITSRSARSNRAKRERGERSGLTTTAGLRVVGLLCGLVMGGFGILLLVS
jgi:hypothetical protein